MPQQYNLLIFSLLILLPLQTIAQGQEDKWAGVGVETNYVRGKILRHSKKFPTQLPKSVNMVEVNAVFQTHGTKDWQQRRNYPVLGIGFMYTDYGIDSIYGKCFSIYPNFEIPILHYKDFEWTAKLAFGLGYITRPYERYPSYDTFNTAIGSHMNNFTLVSSDIRYRVNHHIDVQLGGTFTHVSNAAFRTPNLGINTAGWHVGLRYFPTTSQPKRIDRNPTALSNRWIYRLRLGMAGKENATPDGPLYPVYLVSGYVGKRYWSKNYALVGLDYSYHTNVYAFLRNNGIRIGDEKAASWKSAVFIGNEFMMGKVGLLLQAGVYVKRYELPESPFYQKLGANVYLMQKEEGILKEVAASILLKTHLFEAELVEVGIGVGF